MGGAENIVANYLCELKRQGHDVLAISIDARKFYLSEQLEKQNIPIYHLTPYVINNDVSLFIRIFLQKLNKYSSYFDKRLSKIVGRKKPEIIHWHTTICYNKFITLPLGQQFFTFHADFKRIWKLFTEEERLVYRQSVGLGLTTIVLNETMYQDAQELFQNSKIHRIPNGLSIGDIRSKRYVKEEFVSSIGLPEDSFIITMVGRFHPVKNQEWAIDVLDEVLKNKSNAYLLYVGQEEKSVRKIIDERILKYNIPIDKVKILGLRKDATAILSVSNVCLVPSRSESFSLVAVEAQVFNIRVVASDAIPSEVLRNPNTFALSLSDSAEDWAKVILDNNTDRTKNHSIEDFDIGTVVKAHVDLYNSVL